MLTFWSVRFGGRRQSSTLAGMLDSIQYIFTVPASFLLARLVDPHTYIALFATASAFWMLGVLAIHALVWVDKQLPARPVVE